MTATKPSQKPDTGVPARAARVGWGGQRGQVATIVEGRRFWPLLMRGLLTLLYLFPCAIFIASGNRRSRSIEITPNKGPGARITNA